MCYILFGTRNVDNGKWINFYSYEQIFELIIDLCDEIQKDKSNGDVWFYKVSRIKIDELYNIIEETVVLKV